LTICDEDNDCDSTTDTKNVLNEAPDPNAGEYSCNEGQTITLTATATDVSGDMPLVYAWDFDGDEDYNDAFGASVSYTCGNGDVELIDVVVVQVTDNDGASGYDDAEITINNLPPVANANGPYHAAVGHSVCLDGSATDAYDTSFTYEWDLAYDGSFNPTEFTENPCDVTYYDDGSYTVALRVYDGDDYSEIDTAEVIVHDYQIEFDSGWNCFSIPLVPNEDDTDINNVLGPSVAENADKIWSYAYDTDAGKNVWKYNEPVDGDYMPSDSSSWNSNPSRLQNIVPGYGYYLFMDDGLTSYHDGEKFYGIDYASSTSIPMPPQVKLTTGWNLIGHYGLNEVALSSEVQDLSGGILTDLADTTVLNENTVPVSALHPTECYWSFITGQNDLWYAPSAEDYSEDA
jgi:hypothetical protein